MSAGPRRDIVLPELLQGQWTTALICTYGADLTFFETRLLSQLAQIPLRVVLADDALLSDTLAEATRTGQRHRLANKAYVAAPLRHPRSAHAKLILLLGRSSGLLIVGSGNLGYEGYAAPGEPWHIFGYSEESPDHINEFAAARAHVDGLVDRGSIDPPVAELLHTAWGQATWLPPSPSEPTAITSSLERPIIERLRELVPLPVDEMIVHAPFHDKDCAALGELINSFSPERLRLLISESTSADPETLRRVLDDAKKPIVEQVQVKSEAAAYIHAKWVHLIHANTETLLTGSANLSRSGLLWDADRGNIEIGVISAGRRGDFAYLYEHLSATPVKDVAKLNISYQSGGEEAPEPVPHPVVLWSRLDGASLTLVFNKPLTDGTAIGLVDHAGNAVATSAMKVDRERARIELLKESAERIAEGGRVQVKLDEDDGKISVTWPYHLAHLRSRLDRGTQRNQLPRLGDLPEQDADLYELLQELDQTLIIDRASVWRIAKPTAPAPPSPDEGQPGVRVEDLDWQRVRRDPRYSGYFTTGRSAALPPTDIQVMLAAIAGRLPELGVTSSDTEGELDEDLGREGDTTSSDDGEAEAAEDELEDELTRRRLPISTRTRMAFDRFVRRYAAALDDASFIGELGPIPATQNAVVFNHLLARLIERDAVSFDVAINAQVKTWRFIWGDEERPGITSDLDPETAEVVWKLLDDGVRAKTLSGIAASAGYVMHDANSSALTRIVRRLLTDIDFDLDVAHLTAASPSPTGARHVLDALHDVAYLSSNAETVECVVGPYGMTRSSAEWRQEPIKRPKRGIHQSYVFVVKDLVDDLTIDLATEMLSRVAVAAYLAGHDGSYFRIRFQGNGRSVAFWDEEDERGAVMVGTEDQDIESIDPPWPAWSERLDELAAELAERGVATA